MACRLTSCNAMQEIYIVLMMTGPEVWTSHRFSLSQVNRNPVYRFDSPFLSPPPTPIPAAYALSATTTSRKQPHITFLTADFIQVRVNPICGQNYESREFLRESLKLSSCQRPFHWNFPSYEDVRAAPSHKHAPEAPFASI